MAFRNDQPVAVRFDAQVDGAFQRNVEVPLAEVAAFHAKHGGWVQNVGFEQDDGSVFWTFGKNWIDRDTGALVRIGAGAYGDLTVWHQPVVKLTSARRHALCTAVNCKAPELRDALPTFNSHLDDYVLHLTEAQRAGCLDAVNRFLADYPTTFIEPELRKAQAILHRAAS